MSHATSGTISGMIDDFNRAIEHLSINDSLHEQGRDMGNHLQQHLRSSSAGKGEKYNDRLQHQASLTSSIPVRRASTGQVDLMIDNYRQQFATTKQQQHYLQNKAAESLSLINQANADIEALQRQKALMASNKEVEQQLAKQQQVLIQQQQQFLQIQLEQQRLQAQMQDQMANVTKLERQQEQHKTEAGASNKNNDNQTIEQNKMANNNINANRTGVNTGTTMTPTPYSSNINNMTTVVKKKETVAVNTDISQQDLIGTQGIRATVMREKGTGSGVVKQDKQVSTSTPPSATTTPTGHHHHHHHQLQHQSLDRIERHYVSGPASQLQQQQQQQLLQRSHRAAASAHQMAPAEQYHIRGGVTRVSNAVAVSAHPLAGTSHQQHYQLTQQQLNRRLPHPLSEDAAAVAAATAHPQGAIPSRSGPASGAMTGTKTKMANQRSNSPMMTRSKTPTTSMIVKKGLPIVSANPVTSSILTKKDPSSARSILGLNQLGYLDLDTKNVSFEGQDSKEKRRKLPTAPKEDESIAAAIATKKLIKEKLCKFWFGYYDLLDAKY